MLGCSMVLVVRAAFDKGIAVIEDCDLDWIVRCVSLWSVKSGFDGMVELPPTVEKLSIL